MAEAPAQPPHTPQGRRTRSGAEFSPFVFTTSNKDTPRSFDAVRVAFLEGLRPQYAVALARRRHNVSAFLNDAVHCYLHHFGWDNAADGNIDDRYKYFEQLQEVCIPAPPPASFLTELNRRIFTTGSSMPTPSIKTNNNIARYESFLSVP
ncbi:hypothetical protein C8R47DRAFT_1218604 [Mycena vitilis]|nr:hypothetical protein C8R47DRAFT_1221039 [Mycena vitilis]KAJ6480756.1 hypothetical protein C8R47DRAFT_1218604 [Mycena vitilis]